MHKQTRSPHRCNQRQSISSVWVISERDSAANSLDNYQEKMGSNDTASHIYLNTTGCNFTRPQTRLLGKKVYCKGFKREHGQQGQIPLEDRVRLWHLPANCSDWVSLPPTTTLHLRHEHKSLRLRATCRLVRDGECAPHALQSK